MATKKLSKEDVLHLAKLAGLTLTEAEIEKNSSRDSNLMLKSGKSISRGIFTKLPRSSLNCLKGMQ